MSQKKNNKKEVFKKINKFMNNPVPLIIFLLILCGVLFVFVINANKNNLILIGSMNSEDAYISRIHCFTNKEMDYFYTTPATYLGDEEVYSYQIGYFVKNSNGELVEFASKSGKFDKAQPLSEIVFEQSSFEIGELNKTRFFFTDTVIENIKDMYFVIRGSSKKDSDVSDINREYKIDNLKLTK